MKAWKKAGFKELDLSSLPNEVLPEAGFELPVSWGMVAKNLVDLGVIDLPKFEKVVKLDEAQRKILTQGSDEKIKINSQNSQFVVDVLWALGLGQKSLAYTEGPMGKEYKKDAANFSSTGGWNLSNGNTMGHYNAHELIGLSEAEQKKVAEIAKNVYRPCCGNSTWFPDCNHGMAALAAIELMVKAGVPESEIYKSVLKLNSFWFGNTYLVIATHFERQGIAWKDVDAKEVLGQKYSSSQGAADITKKVGDLPFQKSGGGGCGA